VGKIDKAGAGRAGCDKKKQQQLGKGGESLFHLFLPDPARPAPAFSIVPTDREPGTGYSLPRLHRNVRGQYSDQKDRCWAELP